MSRSFIVALCIRPNAVFSGQPSASAISAARRMRSTSAGVLISRDYSVFEKRLAFRLARFGRQGVDEFSRGVRLAAVGGPIITPPSDSFLQKGFGLTLASIFGGSSIRGRYKKLGVERPATENDLILANLSFRRDVFLGAGGFNEKLYPNEENELMNRLQHEGHVFVYVPDAYIFRSQRANYRAYLK